MESWLEILKKYYVRIVQQSQRWKFADEMEKPNKGCRQGCARRRRVVDVVVVASSKKLLIKVMNEIILAGRKEEAEQRNND